MQTALTAVRALLYGAGFIYLWWWIAGWVKRFDTAIGIPVPEWSMAPGVVLMIAGGLLGLACVGTFVVRGQGTAAPFDAPRKFVAIGPYRYVRNPMYIGGWAVLIGYGLYDQSVSIILFSLLWFLLFQFFVIFVEEKGLENRFGESYRNYKNSVGRWIPRLKSND